MAENAVVIGVIIAILAMMGIGTMLSFQVKDQNNNTLMSGEIKDGKVHVDENPKGAFDALQDGINQFLQNQHK